MSDAILRAVSRQIVRLLSLELIRAIFFCDNHTATRPVEYGAHRQNDINSVATKRAVNIFGGSGSSTLAREENGDHESIARARQNPDLSPATLFIHQVRKQLITRIGMSQRPKSCLTPRLTQLQHAFLQRPVHTPS